MALRVPVAYNFAIIHISNGAGFVIESYILTLRGNEYKRRVKSKIIFKDSTYEIFIILQCDTLIVIFIVIVISPGCVIVISPG
jgi:hypothetical protein